jgi:hypothetical protein
MSYNLDDFRIKKIENFQIPLAEFYEPRGGYDDWFSKPQIIDFLTNEILIEGDCESCEFKGYLKDGIVELTDISIGGEGSGNFMERAGEDLLKSSTSGTLIARLTWEGGDSVEKLSIIDGIVEKEEL